MSIRTQRRVLGGLLASLVVLGWAGRAAAFCGFYVAGADTSLYANATMVVLMRDGTRTVLSMQNNYQGPPEAFALVIPVPTVLKQDQVKILPKTVFAHVDALGAPRLVEYWETDPCTPLAEVDFARGGIADGGVATAKSGGVVVEAMFAVGEYDVVILSANDSSGLDTWLRDNHYNIPTGAADVLAPYVSGGMKFFVAKVDPARVTFENGQAALSPLRFHYDTPDFSLPVRLGLLNSQGTQDLIVNVLGSSRYELANYPNVTIPTNIRVQDEVRSAFPGFYEALFSQVLEKNPGAIVTEYSWSASSCDPCPTPPLTPTDLATLGADVTQNLVGKNPSLASYTLTRLHYRYTAKSLGEDLVFKEAKPLLGGRGIPDQKGELDQVVTTSDGSGGANNFQGRYVILHAWQGALTCQMPTRGHWGGPMGMSSPAPQAAMNTALTGAAPKAADLSALLAQSIPALAVDATRPLDPLVPRAGSSGAAGKSAAGNKSSEAGSSAGKAGSTASGVRHVKSGCSCRVAAGGSHRGAALGCLVVIVFWAARRRQRRGSGRKLA